MMLLAGFGFVILVTCLLASRARKFHRTDALPSLEGWSLADRGLGPVWTWLLVGGSIFTAYTFISIPGLVYGHGAPGFFALPYTVIVCPLAFVFLPRLWAVAKAHGYVTVADFVRGRFGSAPLALAVALTGILATMPYLALQLLGVRAVLTACRFFPPGAIGDVTLVALFAALALATYRYGLRAPTVISAMKGPAIFAVVIVALVLACIRLGGPGTMFDRAAAALATQPAGDATLLLGSDQYSAYTTLALSSALALLMYPHVLTAGFAASGPDTLRRMTVALPVWAGVLGLFGTLGIAALAAGIHTPQGGSEAAVPLLVCYLMPPLAAGFVFGAITVGALVPAAVMSVAVATLFVRNVYVEYFHPTATPKRQVRIARAVSLITKLGAVAFVFGLRDQAAINLQLLGGVWILQTLPTVVIGLFTRCHRYRALLAGWAAGMAASTFLVVRQGFSSVMPFGIGGSTADVYVGLVALLLNFVIVGLAVAVAAAADRLRLRRRST